MAAPVVQGERVALLGEFLLSGVAVDPSVVRVFVRPPTGTLVELTFPSAELTRADLGLYRALLTVDVPGTWGVRFEGSGVIDAVNELLFNVAPSRVL